MFVVYSEKQIVRFHRDHLLHLLVSPLEYPLYQISELIIINFLSDMFLHFTVFLTTPISSGLDSQIKKKKKLTTLTAMFTVNSEQDTPAHRLLFQERKASLLKES